MKRRTKGAKKSQPGRLRIVAGNWRSRVLDIADVEGLRPTSERIRETLFNWLAPSIEGARCLDLFAGTGSLGLEALSRGATKVVFVESSPKAARTLGKNVKTFAPDDAELYTDDAFSYLQRTTDGPFDIVFLDPPFAADCLAELCTLLAETSLLVPGALVYLEDDRSRPVTLLPDGWQLLKTKTAGNVRYSLAQAS